MALSPVPPYPLRWTTASFWESRPEPLEYLLSPETLRYPPPPSHKQLCKQLCIHYFFLYTILCVHCCVCWLGWIDCRLAYTATAVLNGDFNKDITIMWYSYFSIYGLVFIIVRTHDTQHSHKHTHQMTHIKLTHITHVNPPYTCMCITHVFPPRVQDMDSLARKSTHTVTMNKSASNSTVTEYGHDPSTDLFQVSQPLL